MAYYELGKEYWYSPSKYEGGRPFRYLGTLVGNRSTYDIPMRTNTYYEFSNGGVVTIQYHYGTFKEIYEKCLYTREEMSEQITKDTIKKAFERPMTPYAPYYSDSVFKISPELRKHLESISKPSEPNYKDLFRGYTDKALVEMITNTFKEQIGKNDFDSLLLPQGLFKLVSPQPPKNRIPDRVVFNQDKGKVTVLISKHMDGVAPYWAYTSKVHGTDEYNGYFGFLLSYYKYLIRHLDAPTRKELIDNAFEFPDNKKFIFEGAITQEVLKVVKIQEWGNILDSIIEALKELNGYWDYAEWKEMLRVHELETKREHQKEISKQIKAHQLEIDKLKGDNDKK